jgi:lon-related putative ATP-dependent protease
MPSLTALPATSLYRRCDPDSFPFATTADLEDLTEIIGQDRAINAVRFGIGIRQYGYNIFALGPPGMGKHTFVRQYLEGEAASQPTPDDWCYVNNFNEPHKPRAMQLPAGKANQLRDDMQQLLEELLATLPADFESDEYRNKIEALQNAYHEHREAALKEIRDAAEKQSVALLHTPEGFAFAPARGDEVLGPDEYEKLSETEKIHIQEVIAELQQRLHKLTQLIPHWRKEQRDKVSQLKHEFALRAVGHLIDALQEKYKDLPRVLAYLDAVERDVIENFQDFLQQEETPVSVGSVTITERPSFYRYQVNVLVDHSQTKGAPIVFDDSPMLNNLIGRAEHVSQFGALLTNFTLIKPGSLHHANGGYLLLDIGKLLSRPYSWEALKRALYSKQIRIESLGQILNLVSTVSLEPEQIPLDIKVVLFGDRLFYYLLYEYDPEFGELFKVAADFEELMLRNPDNDLLYARLIGTVGRKEALQPFERGAVARIIEHSARLVGDAERLSTHMQSVADLMREADYWARQGQRQSVNATDVQQAIDTQIERAGRLRDRIQEDILRGTIMIDTDGAVVGQVNGLSVVELGDIDFAQPMRITATTRLGEGEMVNIEREVELSGAIHSKGVLILSSFLAARYAQERPLSLNASLVFEQSYGWVEGDSASAAELCALLSSLSGAPILQSLAITGSINQFGTIQSIGGVNEKIEGFFDICKARGLTGNQGVLIPDSNVKHLMLREDVVQAARDGQFHIYPINTIDQAIELLTGVPAGEPDAEGKLPEGSINYLVAVRLFEFSEVRQLFAGVEKHVRTRKKRK